MCLLLFSAQLECDSVTFMLRPAYHSIPSDLIFSVKVCMSDNNIAQRIPHGIIQISNGSTCYSCIVIDNFSTHFNVCFAFFLPIILFYKFVSFIKVACTHLCWWKHSSLPFVRNVPYKIPASTVWAEDKCLIWLCPLSSYFILFYSGFIWNAYYWMLYVLSVQFKLASKPSKKMVLTNLPRKCY
jgi:hypothetical protein